MGLNSASKNKDDAKKFLEWLATPEFAALYANALPGFFPLSKAPVKIDDDLAATMVGWRKDCKSTIRNSYQILSRGTPNLENELWNVSAQVINGTLTPDAAGKQTAGRPRQVVQARASDASVRAGAKPRSAAFVA